MFTANIKSKTPNPNGTLKVEVEFTDGTKTFIEEVTPQDMDALVYFVRGRLKALNFVSENLPIGPITSPNGEVTPTQAEQDKRAWLNKVQKAYQLKTTLVDTGIFTAGEIGLGALVANIKSTYKAEYLT